MVPAQLVEPGKWLSQFIAHQHFQMGSLSISEQHSRIITLIFASFTARGRDFTTSMAVVSIASRSHILSLLF